MSNRRRLRRQPRNFDERCRHFDLEEVARREEWKRQDAELIRRGGDLDRQAK